MTGSSTVYDSGNGCSQLCSGSFSHLSFSLHAAVLLLIPRDSFEFFAYTLISLLASTHHKMVGYSSTVNFNSLSSEYHSPANSGDVLMGHILWRMTYLIIWVDSETPPCLASILGFVGTFHLSPKRVRFIKLFRAQAVYPRGWLRQLVKVPLKAQTYFLHQWTAAILSSVTRMCTRFHWCCNWGSQFHTWTLPRPHSIPVGAGNAQRCQLS